MKIKLSITVEEDVLLKLMDSVREGRFRNKSHAFEYALKKALYEVKQ